MVEGAGSPGYAPDRQGDLLWQRPPTPVNDYRQPPPSYIAGYLTGETSSGTFNMDLYKLILNDMITGRKPRTIGSKTVRAADGVTMKKMAAGFGKTGMSLQMKPVFTFVDPGSAEATECTSSPFITKAASLTFLNSDPCYTKGSGVGKYSTECLQNTFIANGCLSTGKGYPTDSSKTAALLQDGNGQGQSLEEIANYIYSMAVISSTGNDMNGSKVDITELSAASMFCTGKTITSPCDMVDRSNGPLSTDCLVYLWDNAGENNTREGPTYQSSSRSLFSSGKINRFCTRSGSMAPRTANGSDNTVAINYWKKLGGVAAVKAAMNSISLIRSW
jgi:hypothetical protein